MASGKDQPFDMQFKLLMIGDSGMDTPLQLLKMAALTYFLMYVMPSHCTEVGKTCLIWRYASDQFSTKTMNTIGIDFKIKYIKIDDVKIKLQVCLAFHFARQISSMLHCSLPITDLGYSWSRALPHDHHVILSRRPGHIAGV